MLAVAPRPSRRLRLRRRPSLLLLLTILLALPGLGAQAACLVDYRVTNEWGSGFTAEVTLTNQDAGGWSGWSLSWTMPDGQQVTHLWNGGYDQQGSVVSVADAGWNGTVAAGASVSFGFNGSHAGANGIPWDVAVDGETCGGQTPPETEPDPVSDPEPDPLHACTVDYSIRQDWGSGATVDVTVTNDGDPLAGWTLAWTLPDGQQITGGWNGSFSQTGAGVQVTPAGWNTNIAAGGSIGIGFNLSHDGQNRVPGDVALNGVVCDGQQPPPAPDPDPVACTLDYQVREQWADGATIDVTVHNTGGAVQDWTLAWTMPAGQTITGLWNGVHQQSGDAVTVTPAGWNADIASGSTLELGFNLAHAGFNPPPIDLTLDGVRCDGQPDEIVYPPQVPQGLAAATIDNARARLTWDPVPGEPDRLELQRRADGGAWQDLAALAGDAVVYLDEAMALEVAYDYRLRTVNAAGPSAYGSIASARLRDRSVIPVTALADNCAICHGPDGASGGPAVPGIAGLSVDYFVRTMEGYRDGTRFGTIMNRIAPGYTDAQILALAEHFALLPFTETVQTTDPLLAARGAELHDQVCWFCHGPDGADDSVTGVRLAGQWRPYLETTLLDYAAGLSPAQPGEMADEVSYLHSLYGDEAMTALAHFYAGGAPGDGGDGGSDSGGDTGNDGGDSGGDAGDPEQPPAAPAGLGARILASGAVELDWTDGSDNELGFRIERAAASGAWTTLITVGAGVQVHQDLAATLGQGYDYRVTAVNLAGESASITTSIALPSLAEFGAMQYADHSCGSCHGADGSGGFLNLPLNGFDADAFASLTATTAATMPPSDPGSCTGLCAESLAAYMIDVLSADAAGGGDGDGGGRACEGTEPAGVRSLRLLTRREYQNTVNDLLGLQRDDLINRLPVENRILGFDNNAEHNRVTAVHFETYLTLAEELAAAAVAADRDGLLPCAPTEPGCAAAFVDAFGKRAFRRPLTAEERTWYLDLFAARGFDDAMRLAITAMLASPSFLYRSELGELQADGSYRLTGYELASALSYLFLGTLPDDALLAAAERGDLDTSTGLVTQAARLLGLPRARERTGEFAGQWLLARDPYESPSKDLATYPAYTDAVAAAMPQELMHFFNHVVFESSGSFQELLTADYALVNPVLAAFYGLPAPPSDDFAPVAVTDGSRHGLLTLGAVMANYASADASHPFKRGAFFLNRILCQELPPVGNMGVQVPPPDPTLTTRERFDIHSQSNQVCWDCHQYLDGPGFAFEHWDGVGRWRSTENGRPIDASGVLRGLETFQSAEEYLFSDLAQMNAIVANSDNAAQCLATQWYRFATGHEETAADGCALDALKQHYADNGYDIQTLLLGIVNSRAFTHRRAGDGS